MISVSAEAQRGSSELWSSLRSLRYNCVAVIIRDT